MALFSGPVLVAIMCFGSYALAGNTISTTQAYTALAFFSLLRFPMSFLPMLISSVVNAVVALNRIQAFLTKPEAESVLGKDAAAVDGEAGVVRVGGAAWPGLAYLLDWLGAPRGVWA
jgi:membrane protein implicated in regulation of membrane protease activity